MKRISRLFAALCLAGALAGCQAEEMYNSDIFCYFVYDTGLHNNGLLWAALQPASYGEFVEVSAPIVNGVRYVVSKSVSGQTERIPITTEREVRLTYALGAANGLFIGRTTAGMLVAYDMQCPNCSRENNLYRYPLQINTAMEAVCGTCKRHYQLNNMGAATTSAPRKLDQYLASYNGQVLLVHNKQ